MKKITILIEKEVAELLVGKPGNWDTYTLMLDDQEVVGINHCFIDGSFEEINIQSIWGGGTLNRPSEIMPLLEEMGEIIAHHPSDIVEIIEDYQVFEDMGEVFYDLARKVKQSSFDLDTQLS